MDRIMTIDLDIFITSSFRPKKLNSGRRPRMGPIPIFIYAI